MADYIFDKLLIKGIKSGQIPGRTKDAIDWYRETTRKNVKRVNERKFMAEADESRMTNDPIIGNMYQYFYDAKHKATLPYFDMMPLVFPFKKAKGGFIGLNLHYMPLPLRARLMDSLYQIKTDNRFNDDTKLRLTYTALQGLSESQLATSCIKRYLFSHMKSRAMKIHSTEYDIALFLPTERFYTNNQKIRKDTVWKDSKKRAGVS